MSEEAPSATWTVREEGNKVIIEVTLADAYHAIALCEVVAAGMRSGKLELEFEGAAQKPLLDGAELRNMMRDPRYWRTREPAFIQRVTEGFRMLIGRSKGAA